MNVPGYRLDDDMTCVNGAPFTKSISVRRPIGEMVDGQPAGMPAVPKLGVQVCAHTLPHDHHHPDNTSDPEIIAEPHVEASMVTGAVVEPEFPMLTCSRYTPGFTMIFVPTHFELFALAR